MIRYLFLLLTILSIHFFAGISVAKNNNPDYISRINKAITGTDERNQVQTNLDLLRKRVDELEKKIEKLELKHQLRATPT